MGRVKETPKIPNWFNLSKYSPLGGFNAKQWTILHQNRVRARQLLALSKSGDAEALRLLSTHFENIHADPLLGLVQGSYIFGVLPDALGDGTVKAIRPLTIGMAIRFLEEFRKEHPGERRLLDDLAAVFRGEKEPYFAGGHFDVFSRELAPKSNVVEVNLELPNSRLACDFGTWVSAKRPGSANSREQRAGRLKRWTNTGILPFVDLRQWAEYSGASITIREIVDHFSGKFIDVARDGEQTVRRTLSKEAASWLTEETGKKIAAEAAAQN